MRKRVYSKAFKRASIGLLLNIIQKVNPKDNQKYYKFFEKELKIDPREFENIKEFKEFTQAHNIKLDNEIDIIREELGYKRHRIMNFLMMLNRCIIIDGCDVESYRRFEQVRDNFLKKL
jgi:hypothetical protein